MRYPRAGCQGGREVTHRSRDINPLLMGETRVGVTNRGGRTALKLPSGPGVAMCRGGDWAKSVGLSLALCGAWACATTPQVQSESNTRAIACTLHDAPSISGDTATIAFDALGATREQCALILAAERLRPWPNPSRGPWTVHVALGPTATTVYRLASDAARNVVDAGAALMATDDLSLIAYAATRSDLEVAPLPWDRTYLRLSHASQPLGATVGPDAVHADARLSEPPACELHLTDESPRASATPSKRVVYDGGDRTARELAERIVALVEIGDATAVGLSGAALDAALGHGSELAYIIAVPRASYCEALGALLRPGPWTSSHSALPLIDTRAHGITPRAARP